MSCQRIERARALCVRNVIYGTPVDYGSNRSQCYGITYLRGADCRRHLLANGLACPERHETATIVLRLRDDTNWRTTLLCHGFVCTWIETFFGPCRANPGHLLARSRPWKLLPCRPCSFEPPTRTDPLAPVQRPFQNPSQEARVLR